MRIQRAEGEDRNYLFQSGEVAFHLRVSGPVDPLVLVGFPAGHAGVGDITWQTSYEGAFEAAATDEKIVFVAVNMDGERANDRMLAKVYTDKRIRLLAKRTVNLIASNDVPAKKEKTLNP